MGMLLWSRGIRCLLAVLYFLDLDVPVDQLVDVDDDVDSLDIENCPPSVSGSREYARANEGVVPRCGSSTRALGGSAARALSCGASADWLRSPPFSATESRFSLAALAPATFALSTGAGVVFSPAPASERGSLLGGVAAGGAESSVHAPVALPGFTKKRPS